VPVRGDPSVFDRVNINGIEGDGSAVACMSLKTPREMSAEMELADNLAAVDPRMLHRQRKIGNGLAEAARGC
jgi:hypothetical protein